MSIDPEIIERCIAKDSKAQKLIFEKFKSVMMGICMRYCKTRDEAEDVLLEGFMNIFTGVASYRGDGSFEHWMKRIMINTAINNYRKNLKHYYHSDIDEIEERIFIKSDEPETVSTGDLLKILNELPEGYRVVFNLYAIEGYKHREIAKMLGITTGTSKSQLSKARKILQKKLKIKK